MSPFTEQLIGVIAGGLIGFLAAVFAEPLRQRLLKPKLCLEFGGGPDYFTYTPEGSGEERHEAYYLRVRVTNKSKIMARDCRAYLTNIEKEGEHGQFKRTIYSDTLPLAWSSRKKSELFDKMDIAKDAPHYFNIFSTRSTSNEFSPMIETVPYRYQKLFKETGIFRFTVQLSAHGVDPETRKLRFEWKGVWNDFEVEGLTPEQSLKGLSHEMGYGEE